MDKDALIAGLAQTLKAEWERMTDVALALDEQAIEQLLDSFSQRLQIGRDSLKRKFDAIRYMAALGHTAEEIKAAGQEHVVGRWNRSRQEKNYGKMVTLGWRIPGSQKVIFEREVSRVKGLLDLQTSEQMVDWLIAQLLNATDEEIKASAGEIDSQTK